MNPSAASQLAKFFILVPMEGLEPTLREELRPERSASANFATSASETFILDYALTITDFFSFSSSIFGFFRFFCILCCFMCCIYAKSSDLNRILSKKLCGVIFILYCKIKFLLMSKVDKKFLLHIFCLVVANIPIVLYTKKSCDYVFFSAFFKFNFF